MLRAFMELSRASLEELSASAMALMIEAYALEALSAPAAESRVSAIKLFVI